MLASADPMTILFIASTLLTVGVMVLAKKPKAAPLDDALSSTATRGGYVPLVIGRRRVGPLFAWVDDYTGNDLPTDGPGEGSRPGFGKGGGGVPDPEEYLEQALHILCIGPASRLHAIYQNGEPIWEGPISPLSHPSGTALSLPNNEGWFEIHWGFPDDPVLAPLAASSRHGLGVRYPMTMKILWVWKNLGTSRTWPRLEYEIECPCYSHIAETASELPLEGDEAHPTWGDIDYPLPVGRLAEDKVDLYAIRAVSLPGGEIALLVVDFWYPHNNNPNPNTLLQILPSGGIMKVACWNTADAGNAIYVGNPPDPGPSTYISAGAARLSVTWKYFWIRNSYIASRNLGQIGYTPVSFFGQQIVVILGPEVSGNLILNTSASIPSHPSRSKVNTDPVYGGSVVLTMLTMAAVEPIDTHGTDGCNLIHVIDQLLFAKHPYGAGRDRTKFDTRSIEQAAAVLEGEKIRCSTLIKDGESVAAVLASLLQDAGMFLSWDPLIGKTVFQPLRYSPPEDVTDLPPEMILQGPEMATVRGSRPIDTIAFTFQNRERNYREEPLVVRDDGQIEQLESQRAKKVPIVATTDPGSAARLLPRRQQEALANLSTLVFETNHGTMMAVAGKRISASETEGPGLILRITGVTRNLDSSKVVLDTIIDSYDPPPPTGPGIDFLEGNYQNPTPPEESPHADQMLPLEALEMPRGISGGAISVLIPVARTSKKALKGAVWGSPDGLSFSVLGYTPIVIAGELEEDLPADSPCLDLTSYDAVGVGVDFDLIEDLTGSESSWRAGRQLLLIGDEVCYLRSSGPTSIEGLIRGRLGTTQAFHPQGTQFCVVLAHNAVPLQSSIFLPGRVVSLKVQTLEAKRVSNLAIAEILTLTVSGKGLTPIAPGALRQASLRPDYDVTDDVTVVWTWHSDTYPHTGLGTQLFGSPSGESPPKGYFLAMILDTVSGTPLTQIKCDLPTLTLTVADRTALGLDILTEWGIEVYQVEGSYSSSSVSLTLYPS